MTTPRELQELGARRFVRALRAGAAAARSAAVLVEVDPDEAPDEEDETASEAIDD